MRRLLPLLAFLWIPTISQAQDAVSRRDSLLLIRADSLLRREEPSRALGVYREVLSRNPESYRAQYGIARAYLHQGEPDRALPYLNELIVSWPAEADPRVVRGFALLQQGRLEPAEQDFRWVTDRFPEYAEAWRGLGAALERSGELRRAVEIYGRWIAADPDDADAYLARARLFAELARRDEARDDLQRAARFGASPREVERIRRGIELDPWRDEFTLSTEYAYETFLGKRDAWKRASVRAGYKVESRGALELEFIRADRFEESDRAFRPNLHAELWKKASANILWQFSSNPDFLPENDVYAELFQALPDGWVPSVFYRRMEFSTLRADFFGIGLQKYTRDFYGRARFAVVDVAHRIHPAILGQLRYYFPRNEAHVSVYAGYGWEAIAVGLGPDVETASVLSGAVDLKGFVTKHIGLTLGFTAEYTDIIPARFGFNAGLITRF